MIPGDLNLVRELGLGRKHRANLDVTKQLTHLGTIEGSGLQPFGFAVLPGLLHFPARDFAVEIDVLGQDSKCTLRLLA